MNRIQRLLTLLLFVCGMTTGAWAQTAQLIRDGYLIKTFTGASSLSSAISAAASKGDIIILSSGNFNNPGNITKSVSIYGQGFENTTAIGGERTYISGKIEYKLMSEGALDGIHLEGLYIENDLNILTNIGTTAIVDDFTVIKCHSGGVFFYQRSTNVKLQNCKFDRDVRTYPASYTTTMQVDNCYIEGNLFNFADGSNIIVNNSLIHNNWYQDYSAATSFNNCIIYKNISNGSSATKCIFNQSSVSGSTDNCWMGLNNGDIYVAEGEDGSYSESKSFAVKDTYVGTDDTPVGLQGGIGWNKTPTIPSYLIPDDLSQDDEGYYLLSTKINWIQFAEIVNGGTTNVNARMTADIDLGDDQTMVGTASIPYQGTFDGQGHTLTVNYDIYSANTAVAPFTCVGDATIQNLHVDGSIIQRRCAAGGVAGTIKGNLTVKKCWVSAYLYVQGEGGYEGTIGGIASFCDDPNTSNKSILIEDCLFSGRSAQGRHCGCLMSHVHGSDGYNNSAAFTNCLNLGTCDNPSGSTGTFARKDVQGDPYTITNCYYKTAWQYVQGTQATTAQLADGTTAYKLQNNRADLVWGQRIGIDAEPVLTSDESYRVYRSKNGGYTNDPEEAYEEIKQDNEGYYLLSSAQDWKDFATLVQTTPTANAKLTANIDLGDDQTKIGSFSGIFDGQGHTITINLSTTEQYVGLFCNITDATINNLHVTGAITTNTRFVGGMVGRVYGTSTIQNCWSSVDVTTTYGGDGVQGGMVGCVNGTLNISDCLYNGALNGSSAYTWGGFVGWLYGTTNISNCLFASDEINVGAPYTATHVAGGGTVTNCYYKNVMGSAQGTQASTAQLADGTTAYKLQNNRGDMVWGQRIGTDAMPVLTNDENYRVYRSKTGGYTNNPEEAYEGIQQDGEGNYLLGSLPDWQVFAEIVNSGTNAAANAKMTADIDLGDDQTHIGLMTEGAEPFYAGVFDGQGHTLTVNYVGGSYQIVAPFTQISSATIKNLHVAGSIQSSFAYIGVAGKAGSGSVISNVWMSATMNTTQDGWVQSAAIAGYCDGSIQDCLFTGTYTSNGGGYMGGFYGYTSASPTITNCLSTGTFSQGNWQGNGVHTNCYLKQYPAVLTTGCSWATNETLSDGTITTALQNNRAETVWVQDPLTNQPMLALFAGKYTVPASGSGTFSAKANFTLPDGLDAYYCKNYDTSEGTIGVVAINGVVPAETGVLLKGEPGETYTLTTSNETPATVTDNALVAVTEQTNIAQTAGDYTNFGLSGGVFKKVNSAGGTVKANRAYLHILTSALTAGAREISLVWNEEPTGVTVVQGSGFRVNDYYDLQGRRVVNPARGLYIVNGKKVFIK